VIGKHDRESHPQPSAGAAGTAKNRAVTRHPQSRAAFFSSLLNLNDQPLPGIHGGPVRLVTPGLFGDSQVKWLRQLRFETDESTKLHHATEYRVPHP
jgi:DMSO/TMAO reductase YedYZ molybdopterin-dependent catalytic subunit